LSTRKKRFNLLKKSKPLKIDGIKVVIGGRVYLDPDKLFQEGKFVVLKTQQKDPRENGIYRVTIKRDS
jgi:hypothetical protein